MSKTDPDRTRVELPRGLQPDDAVLMYTTTPDNLLAKRVAHVLVEEGLAACVNLGAESLSMYMWQGTLEGESEVTLTIKTRAARAQDVANRLGALHPYDVPEILVVGPVGGSRAYLQWLADHTQGDASGKDAARTGSDGSPD